MKVIIKGKLYSTETAERIDNYRCSGPGDLRYFDEDLYRKRTGEFFLHGKGGPLSKFRSPADGGGWNGGEDIIPISEIDAKEWVEAHCDVDTYIRLFGAVEE